MQQIHVYIDTSSMPRNIVRPGHDIDQLIELVRANLVRVYLSDIVIREWRSQMITAFRKVVEDMHGSLRDVARQPLTQQLTHHELISRLVKDKDNTLAEASHAASEACDQLIEALKVTVIKIDNGDAVAAFDGYFSGAPPFREQKRRDDLPDAFILCAATRLVRSLPSSTVFAVCHDERLRRAFGEVPGIQAYKDMESLLRSSILKDAMSHLEISRVWTREKRDEAIGLLSRQVGYLSDVFENFAENTLQDGCTVTDDEIPDDNNEAIISGVYGVEDLEIEWDDIDEGGPGWLTVPFKFETDADLSFMVFRGEAFDVPDWVHVELGDFEKEVYFDASGNRRIRVTGRLSFRFAKEDIEGPEVRLPSSVEIEDVEIELADHLDT